MRRTLAVDETKLKVNGQYLFVWAAIDVDSREVLAVDASWHRSTMNSEHVLKKSLRLCLNKPLILVDKVHGIWALLRALGSNGRNHSRTKKPYRKVVQNPERGTRRFYNNFPARKNGVKCVKLYLETFTYWYNNMRTHQTPRKPPSQTLS